MSLHSVAIESYSKQRILLMMHLCTFVIQYPKIVSPKNEECLLKLYFELFSGLCLSMYSVPGLSVNSTECKDVYFYV